MKIWILAGLFISCLAGGVSVFLFKTDNRQHLKLILSFSGAYLFAITILHLIPEVYHSRNSYIGIFVLGGFLFQVLLEQFSEGIEHGHVHKHTQEHFAFPIGIMVSLCLHAFLEGMPLASGPQKQLLFGIGLHHIPAAFALGSVMLQNKVTKSSTIFFLIVFAAMSPSGYLFSESISNGVLGINQYFDEIMAIVIGIFLHISTTILFETSVDHRYSIKKLAAVLAGVAIALFNFLIN